MAWIAVVPPSPRHPYERYQVRYQDGRRQRSAGIYPTKRRAGEGLALGIQRLDLAEADRGQGDDGHIQRIAFTAAAVVLLTAAGALSLGWFNRFF